MNHSLSVEPVAVEHRLRRLEGTVRRWRLLAATGIAVGLLGFAARPSVGGPEGAQVSAPFSVVDSAGKTLLWVGRAPDRRITMELYDGAGNAVARLENPSITGEGRLTLNNGGRRFCYPR